MQRTSSSCHQTPHQSCGHVMLVSFKIGRSTVALVVYIDAGASAENYQFTLVDAACTLKKAWDKVKPGTISKCFHKAGFRMDEVAADVGESTEYGMNSDTGKRFGEWNVQASDYIRVDDNVATSELQEPAAGTDDLTPSTSVVQEPTGPTEEHSDEEEDSEDQTDKMSRKTVLDCVRKINTCLQAERGHKLLNSFNAFVRVVENILRVLYVRRKVIIIQRKIETRKLNREKLDQVDKNT